jgi:hypothetical protein
MDAKIRRELRLLKGYALVSVLMFGALIFVAAQSASQRTKFEEIDVERINVVEKNGTVRLAIANPERLPHPTFYGKEYRGIRSGEAQRGAGMIYFNDEGTEMGGFVWSGRKTEDGGHRAQGLLTFDQYNQNEAIALSYSDRSGKRSAGLAVEDQPSTSIQPVADGLLAIQQLPDGEEKTRRLKEFQETVKREGQVGGATRFFAGRDQSNAATVVLSDPKGRPRLRLTVDASGTPKVEFLDENGKVTHQLPQEPR